MSAVAQTGYDHLGRTLETLSSDIGASEAHGLLCGLLCGGAPRSRELWLLELAPDAEANPPHQAGLEELAAWLRRTEESFDGPGLGFSPLLPEEDQPLPRRAAEMVGWCQGFLYGLGLAGAPLDRLSGEACEGLHDLGEITRLDLSQLASGEQEEVDLAELIEFIWVAVMLVREELVYAPRGE